MDYDEELEINAVEIKINPKLRKQLQNISQVQKNAEKLNKIINQLQSDPCSKLHKVYTWLNQKLYRQEKRKWRLVLTKELGEDLIKEIHTIYGLSLIHI